MRKKQEEEARAIWFRRTPLRSFTITKEGPNLKINRREESCLKGLSLLLLPTIRVKEEGKGGEEKNPS